MSQTKSKGKVSRVSRTDPMDKCGHKHGDSKQHSLQHYASDKERMRQLDSLSGNDAGRSHSFNTEAANVCASRCEVQWLWL